MEWAARGRDTTSDARGTAIFIQDYALFVKLEKSSHQLYTIILEFFYHALFGNHTYNEGQTMASKTLNNENPTRAR